MGVAIMPTLAFSYSSLSECYDVNRFFCLFPFFCGVVTFPSFNHVLYLADGAEMNDIAATAKIALPFLYLRSVASFQF